MRRGPAAVFLKLRQQLRDDAFPLAAVLPDAAAALLPFEGDVPVAGCRAAAQSRCSCGQLVPGRLQVDAERLGDAFVDVLAPAAHAAQRADERDRPVVEAQRRIGDQQVGIEGERVPRPSQSGHMPCGLLKLNSCGLGGS